MDANKHYSKEILEEYMKPDNHPGNEQEISEHLQTCEACQGIVRQIQEQWNEFRESKTKGFY